LGKGKDDMGGIRPDNKTVVASPGNNSGAGHSIQPKLKVNFTMFIPEGKYYNCNKCGERFWGYAFRVKDVPGVYCLDCKNKV